MFGYGWMWHGLVGLDDLASRCRVDVESHRRLPAKNGVSIWSLFSMETAALVAPGIVFWRRASRRGHEGHEYADEGGRERCRQGVRRVDEEP